MRSSIRNGAHARWPGEHGAPVRHRTHGAQRSKATGAMPHARFAAVDATAVGRGGGRHHHTRDPSRARHVSRRAQSPLATQPAFAAATRVALNPQAFNPQAFNPQAFTPHTYAS